MQKSSATIVNFDLESTSDGTHLVDSHGSEDFVSLPCELRETRSGNTFARRLFQEEVLSTIGLSGEESTWDHQHQYTSSCDDVDGAYRFPWRWLRR